MVSYYVMPHLRPATVQDLPEILRIQALCYHSIEPESPAAYINKLQQAPDCSFVIEQAPQQLLAYVFALPIDITQPPALDADNFVVPADADCLYLHDLAIDPAARGLKLSKLLLEAFFKTAAQRQLTQASLIAIQNSGEFWQHYGFHSQHSISQDLYILQKIAGYGDALYMTQQL